MKKDKDISSTTEGFRSADKSGELIPSRLQLVELLTERNRPTTLDSLYKHFKIKNKAAENALSGRLARMQKSGHILLDRKKRYALPEKIDMVLGRVVGHSKGFGFVIPDSGGEDLYLYHNQMRKVLHGDRVLAKTRRIDHKGRKEGIIVEVLVEENREIIGHFHLEGGVGFVEPDDSRFARDITIRGSGFKNAKDGEIVVARIIKHPIEYKHAVGEIIEVVGRDLAPGMETEIALRKHEIPHSWPGEVPKQLNKMKVQLSSVKPESGRKDIRNMPLVTIDGSDARDFDDAVYCEKTKLGWRLVVAIADVSHYVETNSALDLEAYSRGNSVYFPNRVVPMLPEQLSNGICSLNPDEDRFCMVCDMDITGKSEVKKFSFYPGLMHSSARLTYELVNTIVVEKDKNQRKEWNSIVPHLDDLYQLSMCLRGRREIRGAMDFEIPEPFIEFDDNKKIKRISARHRNDAHKLIEECMLAANVCAAKYLQKHKENCAVYRNHEGPDKDGLVDLRKFLSGLGLTLKGSENPEAKDYSRLVDSVANRPEIRGIVQTVLLRSMSQAVYSAELLGHFALAYPVYAHFTSPIRRYPDLIVHRQIKQILKLEKQQAIPGGASFNQVGEHCSFTERRADDATYDVIGWLKAEFMQDKIGKEFQGVISGVKEFGIFVQLDDIFVDGLVHVTALGNDYFHFDPGRFLLEGERSGQRFRLGDKIKIRVARVDMDAARIDFELLSGKKSSENKDKNEKRKKLPKKTKNKKFANQIARKKVRIKKK